MIHQKVDKAAQTTLPNENQLPCGNIGYKTVSKINLSDFAKDVIRDCSTQPKNSVYKTYKQVMMFCPKSGYTIKQVSKYLRYVIRGTARSKLITPVNEHTTNLPDVTNLLTTKTNTLQKNASTTKRKELVRVS